MQRKLQLCSDTRTEETITKTHEKYKNTAQTIQNTVNTSTRFTKNPHITKQVKTTTVQYMK